jgi:hypothetical protein
MQKLFLKKPIKISPEINKENNEIRIYKVIPYNNEKNIIIIGNGPSVLKNDFGSVIDNFDIVVRINRYYPNKHVGSKMTYFFCSPWKLEYNDQIYNTAKNILIWNIINMKSAYDNKDKTIFVNHNKINNFLCDNFKFKKSRPLVSTGIAAIMTFIDLNKFNKIYIHGFDGLVKGEKLHYFEDKINDEDVHSSELEKNFINHYVDKKILFRL